MVIQTMVQKRKDVVIALQEICDEKAEYRGAPTFDYAIGSITVDREGNIHVENEEEGILLRKELQRRRMAMEGQEVIEITLPIEKHSGNTLSNLVFMLNSKHILLNRMLGAECIGVNGRLVEILYANKPTSNEEFMKALELYGGTDALTGIRFEEGNIGFQFPNNKENVKVYVELVSFMLQKASLQQRVNPKQLTVENEKYAFRTWLVSLGFVGERYKESRRTLLKNLTGNSAFRTEEASKAARNKQKGKL